jgi:hypothetical protein
MFYNVFSNHALPAKIQRGRQSDRMRASCQAVLSQYYESNDLNVSVSGYNDFIAKYFS